MYLRPQHIVPPSIRTILLLTIGALTLLIVSLAVYEIATQVQYLIKIRALRQAIMVNDHLFGATEKLSQERDMAYSLFYVGDKDSMAGLSSRLDVVRAQTDKALLDSLDAVKQYHFLDQDVPLQQMKAQFSALQELRAAIDKALALPPRKRDNALAERWFAETTVLILQTQNIWMDLISHFSRVDPQVSLHMRFKYMLGIIVDYSGREHSVIARLIAENTKPSDQELAQLVEWRGALGLAWKITDMLANHGGLEPGITTYLTEAQRHSFILYDTTKGTFYIPELFHGDPISINVLLKHAAQASGSLYALKDVALCETGTYMAALEMRMWRRITVDALFLVFAFLLSFYSFRIVMTGLSVPSMR